MTHPTPVQKNECPVCKSERVVPFFEEIGAPIHCNLLWPDAEGAVNAPRGDIKLASCKSCSHIFNIAFEPSKMEYTQRYENSLHFSPRFQDYARSLAERLVRDYDLHGKRIVEIGCGKGEFLSMICQLGDNRGTGFDPSIDNEMAKGSNGRVSLVKDFYSEAYSSHEADLIVCRHVLEHIHAPWEFLSDLRRIIGSRNDTAVFFEVPNAAFVLEGMSVWDLIYEHFSYFTKSSLVSLFELSGFEVRGLDEEFDGQFVSIQAFPTGKGSGVGRNNTVSSGKDFQLAEEFAHNYRRKIELWESKLEGIARSGRKAVVWGAGSKGVTYLNIVKSSRCIEYVVDINPRKNGMHVAGTGQRIVEPGFLKEYRPDAVLVMNSVYLQEIRQTLDHLQLSAELIQV